MKFVADCFRAHLVEFYLCLIAATVLAAMALLKWKFAGNVGHWPAVTGRIENVFVDVLSRGLDRSPRTLTVLAYEYSVAGEYYSGEIRLEVGEWAVEDAEKELVGKEITVHYDPKEPGVSVFLKHRIRGWYVVKDRRLSLFAWFENL